MVKDLLSELSTSFDDLKIRYATVSGMTKQFKITLQNTELEYLDVNENFLDIEVVTRILEKFINESNRGVLDELEDFINTGLKTTFPDTLSSFKAEYALRGSDPVIKFSINEFDNFSPLKKSQSGGLVEIISLMIRIFIIIKKNKKRFLFLDEALNGVSDEGGFSSYASSLLRTICDRYKFTVLLVTHKDNLSSESFKVYDTEVVQGDLPYLKILNS